MFVSAVFVGFDYLIFFFEIAKAHILIVLFVKLLVCTGQQRSWKRVKLIAFFAHIISLDILRKVGLEIETSWVSCVLTELALKRNE